MKHTYLSGVAVALALLAGRSALAEGPEAHDMLGLIEFITQNSSLEYAGQDLPGVTVVPEDELLRLLRSAHAAAYAEQDDRSFALVSALYDPSLNSIFLADVNAAAGVSLFHELVHFLQDLNGKSARFASHRACLEAEAYELQALWQTEHGIDLASKPEYGFVMTFYGVCNDADFSWIGSSHGP